MAVPACAAVAALALVVGATSQGVVPKELVLPSGSGLTASGGVVQTPDGNLWVTDQVNGVCRVKTDDPRGLVLDEYCDATHLGPGEATAIAFDPGTSNFYVGDQDSGDNGVWRLHLDPLTGVIDSAVKIADVGDRVHAVALADSDGVGGPEVYFSTKRLTTIRKISDPAGTPVLGVAGVASNKGVPSLAALGTTLYLAEPDGVTQLDLTSVPQTAIPIPGLAVAFPGGEASGLAVDAARNRLYAGTFNVNGIDQVDALDLTDLSVETYANGFAGVGGMSVDAAGAVLMVDDPAAAAGAQGGAGQGRLWRLPLSPLDTPVTAITQAPPTFTNETSVSFAFESRPGVSFMCRVDDEPSALPCTSPVPLAGLNEGLHVFEVHAVDPDPAIGAGEIARRSFVVDTTAPVVRVDNPDADRELTRDWIDLRFSSNETGASFECSFDGGGAGPCDSPWRLEDLALGDHDFHVTGRDLAGNESNPADPLSAFAFTVRPAPTPPPPPDDDNSGPGGGGGPGPGTSDPRSVITPDAGPLAVLRPTVVTLSRRRLRQRRLFTHPLGIAFNAPTGASYARITLQQYRRGAAVASRPAGTVLARLVTEVEGGRRTYVHWRLTRRQARALARHPGRYRLTVAVGQTRRTFGPQVVLAMRVLRG